MSNAATLKWKRKYSGFRTQQSLTFLIQMRCSLGEIQWLSFIRICLIPMCVNKNTLYLLILPFSTKEQEIDRVLEDKDKR